MQRYVSPNGYSDDYGPNVAQILKHGSRKVVGKVPARIRAELREAVAAGVLGHIKKDGLKPEVFYHPQRRANAVEIRERHAAYAISCIAKCVA